MGGDLPVGITRAQPDGQLLPALRVETFGGHDQQLADAVQRVASAAAVAQRVLLEAAADLIHALVREPDHVPVIHDKRGVAQVDAHRCRVPPVRVECHDADTGQPRPIPARQPAGHCPGGAIRYHVEQPAGGGVDQP